MCPCQCLTGSELHGTYRRANNSRSRTVGIVAVDPTSPFTGGAILGDRVRMMELHSDPGVFMRSMATRGVMGGLARSTLDVVLLLDAFGKDVVMVENERLKAEIQSLRDELAQAREQIAVLTAENERPKTAEPTRSRNHPRHEDELLMASLRDRVSRGELVEMRLGVHQTRSFFITQGMMDTAYKIKKQLERGALKEADAFEALQRIAVADQA